MLITVIIIIRTKFIKTRVIVVSTVAVVVSLFRYVEVRRSVILCHRVKHRGTQTHSNPIKIVITVMIVIIICMMTMITTFTETAITNVSKTFTMMQTQRLVCLKAILQMKSKCVWHVYIVLYALTQIHN